MDCFATLAMTKSRVSRCRCVLRNDQRPGLTVGSGELMRQWTIAALCALSRVRQRRNWMRRMAFLSVLAFVASCSDHAATAPYTEIPPELVDLNDNVFRCMQDVQWTYAERSEHCVRSEEHTSELQSLMRISYAVLCLKKKK